MSELNVVVIGGVSCGPKSAARLKRLMPEANVTLIERGDYEETLPSLRNSTT